MGKAYIGFISQQGLLALCPEEAPVSTLLVRQLDQPASAKTVCCWAVLDDQAASQVIRCLRAGRPQTALETLSIRAEHLGRWCPFSKPQLVDDAA
jgi:hypothetical protein